MKARCIKVAAQAKQRAWSASPRRPWVAVGRLRNIARRLGARPAPSESIGRAEGLSFVVSPVLR